MKNFPLTTFALGMACGWLLMCAYLHPPRLPTSPVGVLRLLWTGEPNQYVPPPAAAPLWRVSLHRAAWHWARAVEARDEATRERRRELALYWLGVAVRDGWARLWGAGMVEV